MWNNPGRFGRSPRVWGAGRLYPPKLAGMAQISWGWCKCKIPARYERFLADSSGGSSQNSWALCGAGLLLLVREGGQERFGRAFMGPGWRFGALVLGGFEKVRNWGVDQLRTYKRHNHLTFWSLVGVWRPFDVFPFRNRDHGSVNPVLNPSSFPFNGSGFIGLGLKP